MERINFYLDKRYKKEPKPILYSTKLDGKRKVGSTGIKVDSKSWDSKRQRIIGERNHELEQVRERVLRKQDFVLQESPLSQRLKQIGITSWDDFKYDFPLVYAKYFRLSVNTVAKDIVCLKSMLKKVYETGGTNNTEWKTWKVKQEPAEIIALTQEELSRIASLQLDKPHLGLARDYLLLGCTVGLRVGDLTSIDENSIFLEESVLIVTTAKTGKKVRVPLQPFVVDILRKRGGKLPYMPPQKLNKYIKRIGSLADMGSKEKKTIKMTDGIKEVVTTRANLLTCHRMRATFATLLLKSGVPTEQVMELGGWKSYKAFSRYVKFSEQDHKNALEKTFGSILV